MQPIENIEKKLAQVVPQIHDAPIVAIDGCPALPIPVFPWYGPLVSFLSEFVGLMSLYVTAVDKLIKRPQDNPTIGILIWQKVNREMVEWTLEGFINK